MAYKYCKTCGEEMNRPTLRQALLEHTQACPRCHEVEFIGQDEGFIMLVEWWEETHHFNERACQEIRNEEREHILYKTGDTDAPDSIQDRNGEVVLSLCRVCNLGESELDENLYCTGA